MATKRTTQNLAKAEDIGPLVPPMQLKIPVKPVELSKELELAKHKIHWALDI